MYLIPPHCNMLLLLQTFRLMLFRLSFQRFSTQHVLEHNQIFLRTELSSVRKVNRQVSDTSYHFSISILMKKKLRTKIAMQTVKYVLIHHVEILQNTLLYTATCRCFTHFSSWFFNSRNKAIKGCQYNLPVQYIVGRQILRYSVMCIIII